MLRPKCGTPLEMPEEAQRISGISRSQIEKTENDLQLTSFNNLYSYFRMGQGNNP